MTNWQKNNVVFLLNMGQKSNKLKFYKKKLHTFAIPKH